MPLDQIKAGLAVATDDDDTTLSGHIAAAVSLIEQETGVPLIDREYVLETRQPSADGAVLLRYRDISAVASITYWPAGTTVSAVPTTSAAFVGRVDTGPYRALVYPPVGWPDFEPGTPVRATVTVGVGLEAIPDIADAGYGAVVANRYHNLREAVLPLVQRLYDGSDAQDFALARLLEGFTRRSFATDEARVVSR